MVVKKPLYSDEYIKWFLDSITLQENKVHNMCENNSTAERYKTKQPFTRTDIKIQWEGWTTTPSQLSGSGWDLELVTNKFSDSKKVYIRHKQNKILGRFIYHPESEYGDIQQYQLDFLIYEKNIRYIDADKFRLKFPNSKYTSDNTLIDISNKSVAEILDIIANIQKQDLKPLPKKTADIIDLIEQANLLGIKKSA